MNENVRQLSDTAFQLVVPYEPAGDQPQTIAALIDGLYIRRALKQIAEKDQPEQHRLDQREQHAEFFPTQSADPPQRQVLDFLPTVRYVSP